MDWRATTVGRGMPGGPRHIFSMEGMLRPENQRWNSVGSTVSIYGSRNGESGPSPEAVRP